MARPRIALRPIDWPEQDRRIWTACIGQGRDVFDDSGPAAQLSNASKTAFANVYGRWLAFLASSCPAALSFPPGERVNRERIQEFSEGLLASNRASSLVTQLDQLRQMMRYLAPEADWQWLSAVVQRIRAQAVPRAKRPRLRDSAELYQLGLDLMAQAERQNECDVGTSNVALALLYQDGLMLALLAAFPLRRRNLAGLRLGTHMLKSQDGLWTISIPGVETKNRKALELPVGAALSSSVDRFLSTFRSSFPAASSHDSLWPSMKRGPMLPNAIWDMVSRRTKAAFGIPINPHLFRDAAANFWADEAPADFAGVRDLLGHASLSTTERHYVTVQTREAARALWPAAGLEERR